MPKSLTLLLALIALAPAPVAACGKRPPPSAPILLGSQPVTVPVRIAAGAGRPFVVVGGLDYARPPRVLVAVSLRGPDGRRERIGLINFYAETGYGGSGGGGGGGGAAKRDYAFDAGPALAALGGRAEAVVFEPISGVAGVPARPDPAARLRVSAVTIERR